jgi:hypothetical protein
MGMDRPDRFTGRAILINVGHSFVSLHFADRLCGMRPTSPLCAGTMSPGRVLNDPGTATYSPNMRLPLQLPEPYVSTRPCACLLLVGPEQIIAQAHATHREADRQALM